MQSQENSPVDESAVDFEGFFRIGQPSWWVVVALWTLWGLLSGAAGFIGFSRVNMDVSWAPLLFNEVTDWILWAFCMPLIAWIGDRYPLTRANGLRYGMIHVAIALPFCTALFFLQLGKCWALYRLLNIEPPYTWFRFNLPDYFLILWYLFIYGMILGAYYTYRYYRLLHLRQLQEVRLQDQLTRCRLRILGHRLQPHFLFNALHSVAGLVQSRENERAVDMIARLSDLLRYALDEAERSEVTVQRELEFVRRYIEIEKLRFGERLDVRYEIQPGALTAHLPSFILQPLVENALRHGIQECRGQGVVTISASRRDDRLCVRIRDNGAGLSRRDRATATQVGLAITGERLQTLYPGRYRFDLQNAEGGGAVAILELPFHNIPAGTTAGE